MLSRVLLSRDLDKYLTFDHSLQNHDSIYLRRQRNPAPLTRAINSSDALEFNRSFLRAIAIALAVEALASLLLFAAFHFGRIIR